MKRDIIKINEDLCNGCGACIPNCHEGALQMIDGKARLVSDLMCDGLGACIGHCPQDAISIEKREATPYDEITVIKEMIPKGKNTVKAHLQHLWEHDQHEFVQQGINHLKGHKDELDFTLDEVMPGDKKQPESCGSGHSHGGGHACPGSAIKEMKRSSEPKTASAPVSDESKLEHWPVQLHLANPEAPYFKGADLLIAADCTAFSMGNFHDKLLKDRKLVIACPKLDSNQNSYLDKLTHIFANAGLNTVTVAIMEVPCCGSLSQLVMTAMQRSGNMVPVKQIIVGVDGEIRQEGWVNVGMSA
ncbi:MAG TPA: 4Fe-4S dicluster domain-containing protein [Bacteroidales bacterium]|nr:4Fe-4S dicluster domain-containing protein [Bacteroidales bacterium]